MSKELEVVKDIANDFNQMGGCIYFVGGYVRDKILGYDTKDIDVEMYGIEYEKVKEILGKYGKIDLIGESFGVLKIKGLNIDFAFPRKENSIGMGHKNFEITINPFSTTKDASKRRDFTINSIMENVLTGEIIDNFGGIEDLKLKKIKHIDEKRFVEDELRALRACQFASRFEFEIDEETTELCKKFDLNQLSKERIYEELKKALLKSNTPSIFFEELLKMEKFETIFFTDKTNRFNGEYLNDFNNLLNAAAKLKEKSSHQELFMISSMIFGLEELIIGFDKEQFMVNLIYKKELCNNIKKILESSEKINNLNSNISNYELKLIAVNSQNKFFNIDDVILFNKLTNNNFPQKMEIKINEIGLNENRGIVPVIDGKILNQLKIPVSKMYKEFLDNCFEFQLREDENGLFKYLLELILLYSNKPSIFFNKLKQENLLEKYIPELLDMDKTLQNPIHHPEGSVYNHTMQVIDNAVFYRDSAENKYEFMFSALCHDFGKVSTTTINEEGKIISYNHEKHTEETEKFLERLEIREKSKNIILSLIITHMRPFMLYKQNSKRSAINKLERDSNNNLHDLLLLSYADKLGTGNYSEEKVEEIKKCREWFEEKTKE